MRLKCLQSLQPLYSSEELKVSDAKYRYLIHHFDDDDDDLISHMSIFLYIFFSSWGSEIINYRQRGRNFNSISYFISRNIFGI